MKTKTTLAVGLALVAVPIGAVSATGTTEPPPDVVSTMLARGSANELRIEDAAVGVTLLAEQPTDVAFVGATIVPSGETGWHTHPGPSIIVVAVGALTMQSAHEGACAEHEFAEGAAFVHPAGNHNFVAGADGVEFYVSYYVPAGTEALLTPAEAPPECSS